MTLSRRAFLAACGLAAASGRAAGVQTTDELPWEAIRAWLRARYPDLRRHFAFEYYPWYANAPFNHWQQWGRVPPVDLAGSSMPLLGAYDSRATAVIEQHARWIVESGVGVVNLSWWGPGSFTDRAVSRVMDVMHAHDLEVAFHLEPYGAVRAERLADDVAYLLREYGERRGWDCFYLNRRADGREGPVFKLFATTVASHVVDCHGVRQPVAGYVSDDRWRRATDRVRAAQGASFPHLLLLSDEVWHPARVRASGFDGIANYDPSVEPSRWLGAAAAALRLGLVCSFNVNPGLDYIRRREVAPDACYEPPPFLPAAPDLDWTRRADRERAARLAEARIADTFGLNLWLQTEPWFGNDDAGFLLTYITSFNEWHEGTQFEPMKAAADLTPTERSVGYHNPEDGFHRLRRLTALMDRLGEAPRPGATSGEAGRPRRR